MYHLEKESTLIKECYYDEDKEELTVCMHYGSYYTYIDVPLEFFLIFADEKSLGKFYLSLIKNKFKLKNYTMERPETTNKASNKKRFIKLSINVKDINKDWLHVGESGVYLNCTLLMLPDGELDRYGNLGMIVQDVPKKVYAANKDEKGVILGNGAEFAPKAHEGTPGVETGKTVADNKASADDLPF